MHDGLYLLAALGVAAAVLAHRVATRGIFALTVRDGAVVRARGRISAGLLGDLREVLAGSGAAGTVRAIDGGGATAAVELRGRFPDPVAQRVRNVIGTVPLARLRAGTAR